MGFFDDYEDGSGLSFVGKEEKEELIQSKKAMTVARVFKAVSRFGPRYVVIVDIDSEERALGFAAETVESRDRLLDALIEYLDQEENEVEPVSIFLERVDRSILIRDASTALSQE